MKIRIFSFSESGSEIARELEDKLEYQTYHSSSKDLEKGIRPVLNEDWKNLDGIIFIGALGIAVRMIAPLIEHKTKDPAVIVVDDLGTYAISLLSGHLGGANELTLEVAELLAAQPIITTASDNRGIEALDLFAQANNYAMEDMKSITRLTSMMVDGKKIGFFSEDDKIINYPNLKTFTKLEDIKNARDIDGAILVTSNLVEKEELGSLDHAILRPKNLNIGIGCRKGVSGERIRMAIDELFRELKLSKESIKEIGTVEVKKDELGIIETANYFRVNMKIFSLDEIGRVDHKFGRSEFVKDTIGVYSVAEPSAYLLGGRFISKRTSHDGITLSITKEDIDG